MSHQGDYGYAVARVRAMERRFLDASVMQRMIDAEDAASVMKVLGETSYAAAVAANAGETNFDGILEAELRDTYGEINLFVPDRALVSLMLLQYDSHNVKVLLKSLFNARGGGKKRWDLLTTLGSYPADELITNIETENYGLLPYGLNLLIPRCISLWEQNGDVLEVERLLDKRMYEVMLEAAASLDMPGAAEWVQTRVDGENLRTLVRLKRFGFESARALPFLHEGGTIAPDLLAPLISEPFDSWARALEFSDYGKLLSRLEFSGDFSGLILALEKALDEYYLERLAIFRYSQSAPENILLYLWAKEMEIKNVRMILVAKGGGGDGESLRRLLRNVCE